MKPEISTSVLHSFRGKVSGTSCIFTACLNNGIPYRHEERGNPFLNMG